MNTLTAQLSRLRPFSLMWLAAAVTILLVWLLPWQLPSWQVPAPRLLLALLSILAYGLLCRMTVFRPAAALTPVPSSLEQADLDRVDLDCGSAATLVVHASQTGTAEQLATRAAQSLRAAGHIVDLLPLDQLRVDALQRCRRALFVLATTGEGDAPDEGLHFVERVMTGQPDLSMLEYSLLALGDSSYADFCGFARQFEAWLQAGAAQALHPRIEVDCDDAKAIALWRTTVQVLAGDAGSMDLSLRPFSRWRLRSRQLLNPGSAGMPCFHVELEPVDGQLHWLPGDIAQVRPRNAMARVHAFLAVMQLDGRQQVVVDGMPMRLAQALQQSQLPLLPDCAGMDAQSLAAGLRPLAPRSYSIASLPQDGSVHLLVRQASDAGHRPGVASAWLTEHADTSVDIELRIGRNPRFRAPVDDRPLILIGNGTGLAGLLGLLRHRIARGQQRNWLLFGERNADRDFFHADLLTHWHAQGDIERLDAVFSRDQPQRSYVQHRLAAQASRLHQWVREGADIIVCGSLQGMAPGVDAALAQVLGRERVDELRAARRYRRDVY